MRGVYLRPRRRVMLPAMSPTPAAVALVSARPVSVRIRAALRPGRDRDRGAARVGRASAHLVPGHDAGSASLWPLHARQAAHRLPRRDVRAAALELPHRVLCGVSWSWAAEAATLAAYMAGSSTWDLLWFVLNPRFGWAPLPQGRGLVARPDLDRALPDRLLGSARALARARGERAPRELRARRPCPPGRAARRVRGAHSGLQSGRARVHALVPAHAPPRCRRARPLLAAVGRSGLDALLGRFRAARRRAWFAVFIVALRQRPPRPPPGGTSSGMVRCAHRCLTATPS